MEQEQGNSRPLRIMGNTIKYLLLLSLMAYPLASAVYYAFFFLALFVYLLGLCIFSEIRSTLSNTPLLKILGLLVILAGLSLIWAVDTDAALRGGSKVLQAFLAYCMFYFSLIQARNVRGFLQAFLLVVLGISIYSILGFEYGWESRRAQALFTNSNTLAALLLLCAPLAAGVTLSPELPLWRRFLSLIALAASLYALMLTQTRGAWLGMLAGLMAFCILRDRRLAILVILAILLLGSLYLEHGDLSFLPDAMERRADTIFSLRAYESRFNIWENGLAMFQDHSRYGLGVGIGNFRVLYPEYHPRGRTFIHAHNIYYHLFLELGFLGAFFLLYLLYTLGKTSIKALQQYRGHPPYSILTGLIASLAGYAIHGLSHVALHDRGTAHLFMFILAAVMFHKPNEETST